LKILSFLDFSQKKIFKNFNKTEDEMAEEEYLKIKKK